MFTHALAFYGDTFDGTAGNVTLPVVSDPVIRSDSNILKLSDDWDVIAAFVGGANATKARLSSGSLRVGGYPNLQPVATSNLPGSIPKINDWRNRPLTLKAGENAVLQVTNTVAADCAGVLILGARGYNFNVNRMNLRTLRFTATVTSSEGAWSAPAAVTFEDDLPANTYSVYGLHCWHASGILARLIFNNQVYRPGTLMGNAVSDIPAAMNNLGQGLMGTFSANVTPMIETLHNAAVAGGTINGFMTVGF